MKDSNHNLIVQIIVSGKVTSNVSLLQQTIGLKLLSFWIFLLFTFIWNKLWSFLSTFEEMFPWTAALDHPNYFRLVCILLNYMRNLPAAVFKVFFPKGYFTVKKTSRVFSAIRIDQPNKLNNKVVKTDDVAIGIFDSERTLLNGYLQGHIYLISHWKRISIETFITGWRILEIYYPFASVFPQANVSKFLQKRFCLRLLQNLLMMQNQ